MPEDCRYDHNIPSRTGNRTFFPDRQLEVIQIFLSVYNLQIEHGVHQDRSQCKQKDHQNCDPGGYDIDKAIFKTIKQGP